MRPARNSSPRAGKQTVKLQARRRFADFTAIVRASASDAEVLAGLRRLGARVRPRRGSTGWRFEEQVQRAE
jgi:hypothetical protein